MYFPKSIHSLLNICLRFAYVRVKERPRLVTTYKQITEMQYRCCPGFFGENCDMGKINETNIGQTDMETFAPIRMLQLHYARTDGTAFEVRGRNHSWRQWELQLRWPASTVVHSSWTARYEPCHYYT